jgi:hypothetical protein
VVSVIGEMVLSSAAEAKAFADQVKAEMTQNAGNMPAEFQKLAKSVVIATSGESVTIKFSLTEKELMSLIGLAMTAM